MKGALSFLAVTAVSVFAQVPQAPPAVPTPRPQPFGPIPPRVLTPLTAPTAIGGVAIQPSIVALPNGMVATNYVYMAPNGTVLGMVPSSLLNLRTNLAVNDLTASFPPPSPLGVTPEANPPAFTSSIPVVTNFALGVPTDTNQAAAAGVVTNITPGLPTDIPAPPTVTVPPAVGSAPGTQTGTQAAPAAPPPVVGPMWPLPPSSTPVRRPPGPHIPRPGR